MTRFPLFSAVISSIIFLIISLLVLAGFFLPALQRTRKHIPTQSQPQPQTPHTQRQREKQRSGLSDDSEDYDDDEKPSQSRRRSVSSGRIRFPLALVSFINLHAQLKMVYSLANQDADVKAEAPASVIPEAPAGSSSTNTTPLRRRRSRLSQSLAEEDS